MPITGTQKIKLTRKDFLHLRECGERCVLEIDTFNLVQGFKSPLRTNVWGDSSSMPQNTTYTAYTGC